MMEKAGADAIEVNLSCPHGSIAFRGDSDLDSEQIKYFVTGVEDKILETASLIRKAVKIPLIAKISPQLTSPVMLVKKLEEVGFNGVTIFNRLTGLEINLETDTPIMHGGYFSRRNNRSDMFGDSYERI
jgi:dihydroorotate dehydrogenase (fumarate)